MDTDLPDIRWLADTVCIARPIDGLEPPLSAAEAELVAQVAPRRRLHFAAGRDCAHEALRQLGRPVPELLRFESGAPAWPAGCVGSIAHCDGAAAAVAAFDSAWLALGIDVEPAAVLPADVAAYALTAAEREALQRAPGGLAALGLVAFSAKECVHKCVHPLREAFLEFDEVEIELDLEAGRFMPRPRSAAARAAFEGLRREGRWLRAGGYVWTLLALA